MDVARGLLPFLHVAGQLKRTARSGWIRSGVKDVESVAEHSWRVALLAMSLPTPGPNDRYQYDVQRAVRMSIVHDLQEAVVGDIMPPQHSGVSLEAKHELERAAVARLTEGLPESSGLKEEWPQLFAEYEAGQTDTALFVKDLDKAEMLLQAVEYEREQDVDLQDFFDTTVAKIRTPAVRELVENLERERKEKKTKK